MRSEQGSRSLHGALGPAGAGTAGRGRGLCWEVKSER